MIDKNKEIHEIMDEIMDVLDRTVWYVEIPNSPTNIQKFISRIFFKSNFIKKIKNDNNTF